MLFKSIVYKMLCTLDNKLAHLSTASDESLNNNLSGNLFNFYFQPTTAFMRNVLKKEKNDYDEK